MREPWRSFLYIGLVGSLPLAFWYALWPLRRRLSPPSKVQGNQPGVSHPSVLESES